MAADGMSGNMRDRRGDEAAARLSFGDFDQEQAPASEQPLGALALTSATLVACAFALALYYAL